MVAWSFFLSVSLNNINLLSSKAVCLFKDKKMRVLTNLLVAHLCCEANSFLACATSVKPTAYYPIITKIHYIHYVWRSGPDFLVFSGLRYKLPRHFYPQSFTAFFHREGMGSEHTTARSWEYDWQLGDAPRQLGWLKWRHALLSPPMKEKKDRNKGKNEMKRYWINPYSGSSPSYGHPDR